MTKKQTTTQSKAKTAPKGKADHSSPVKPARGVKAGFKQWMKKELWKVALMLLLVIVAYGFYLNVQIQQSFSGNKWQVPAQIYARPLVFQRGEAMSVKEVQQELELLGYRKVTKPTGAGEYSYWNGRFNIARRAFDFSDHSEARQFLDIHIRNEKVAGIMDMESGEVLTQAKLEPWLATRFISGSREDRMLINLQDTPAGLIQALLLTEDKDFYHHYGIAPLSIARALVANLTAGRTVQGGSTLTQQLVKNLYLSREKSLWRKLKEAYMSVLLDWQYSKDDILEAYLNEVFLGQNGQQAVHGFGLASLYYFDRPIQELGLAELSTLVAIIKGPSRYNPRRYPARVTQRRDLILRLLYENEHISSEEYEHYVQRPLGVVSKSQLARQVHPAYMDKVKRELRQVLPDPDARQSGIRVFTALDPHTQRNAEKTAQSALPAVEKQRKLQDLEMAMVVTDFDTGELRALVGSRDVDYKGFNRALDARRPIGSLVKPAIYLTALEQPFDYHLATMLKDEPVKLKSSYGKYWQPQNADKTFRGKVTLLDALSGSLNVPTVHLGMALGTDNIASTMTRLGVQENIPTYPAMTLGAVDLSPLQVNQMYQTIANEGRFIPLHAITAISSNEGRLLWSFNAPEYIAVEPEAAYLVNYALHKVTQTGTAKSLKNAFPGVNLAGKTGTTDDYRDSWFSGFDHDFLATIWIGKDDNETTHLTGASGALALYTQFQSLQQPRSLAQRFPSELGIAHFNPDTGSVVPRGCKGSLSLPAVLNALPQPGSCDITPPEPVPQEEKSFWERLFGD
ncbi:penicillin-binding protein 1B [Paraneptunicella aestuarii]|nr:penicillin-binding protein 1B [Paraneptunicella aestuarii]UAA38274.1 penicillin-binding protein 1B [Paraneptunicella aestuarii]